MQISDTSGLQGVFEEADFYCQTDSTIYPVTHKTRNVNNRYREILTHIFEVYGGWIFNDSNQSDDTLYADQTLTASTATYAIPANAIKVTGVELKSTGGTWSKLHATTFEELQQYGSVAEKNRTTGTPTMYRLAGDTIELYPLPDYTQASSLRVYFERDISVFLVTDTSVVPGFAAPFHRALSLGISLDYSIAKSDGTPKSVTKYNWLLGLWNAEIKGIRRFYGSRWEKTARINVHDATEEYR